MKTHSGAKKRFKVTGSGKIKRKQAFKRHKLGHKSKSRKNRLGEDALVHPTQVHRIEDLLTL